MAKDGLKFIVTSRLTLWFYAFRLLTWLYLVDAGVIDFFFNKPAGYMYVNGRLNHTFYFKDFL